MAKRRKRKRRRRPSRSPTPAQRSLSPQARPTTSGTETPLTGGQARPGDRAPAPPSPSPNSDPELSGRDEHCSVGEGRIEPHVTNQVRPPPSGTGAERVTQAVEKRLRLLSALDDANRELRHAAASYRSEGATLRELADLMGVSAQAVHKHWLTASSRPGTET